MGNNVDSRFFISSSIHITAHTYTCIARYIHSWYGILQIVPTYYFLLSYSTPKNMMIVMRAAVENASYRTAVPARLGLALFFLSSEQMQTLSVYTVCPNEYGPKVRFNLEY